MPCILVDDDPNNRGKKKARKTTRAGGAGREELLRIAQEQNAIIQKDKEELVKTIRAEAEAAAAEAAAAAAAKEEAQAKARAEAEAKAKARAEAKAKAKAKAKEKETSATAGKGKEKKKTVKKANSKRSADAEKDGGEIKEDIGEDTEDEDFEEEDDGDEEEGGEEAQDMEVVPPGADKPSQPKGETARQGEDENVEIEEPVKGKRKRVRAGALVPDTVIGKILWIYIHFQTPYYTIHVLHYPVHTNVWLCFP